MLHAEHTSNKRMQRRPRSEFHMNRRVRLAAPLMRVVRRGNLTTIEWAIAGLSRLL